MSAQQASSNIACHCAAMPLSGSCNIPPSCNSTPAKLWCQLVTHPPMMFMHIRISLAPPMSPNLPFIPLGKLGSSTHAHHITQSPSQSLKNNDHDTWSLCLSVPIPTDLINPTLRSLVYIIKYATTHDNGNSTVQTDVALTTTSSPTGINLGSPTTKSVYHSGPGYGPRIIDRNLALCLSTAPAVKCNGG